MIWSKETQSPHETLALGRELGRGLLGGEVIGLQGPIGAGKSVLARGIGEALGARLWRGSPTFTLINEYETWPALFHVDLYRLDEGEVEELGLEEYCRPDSVVVIEWPERAAAVVASLPARARCHLSLQIRGPETRTIVAVNAATGPPE